MAESVTFAQDDGGMRGVGRKAVRFANTHLSDDETVAKMGHPAASPMGLVFLSYAAWWATLIFSFSSMMLAAVSRPSI